MTIKMFNENNEIEIVEIGSERHKTLCNLAEIAMKELDIRALEKENKQLKEQLAIREKAFLIMAKQLLKVYDDEGCSYGDCIAGYANTPEEAMEMYIEGVKENTNGANNNKREG